MVLEQHLSMGMMQNLNVVSSLAEESAQFLEISSNQDSAKSYGEAYPYGYHAGGDADHSNYGRFGQFARAETGSVNGSDDCTLSADPTETLSTIGRLDLGPRFAGIPSWKSHPMGVHRAQMLGNPQRLGQLNGSSQMVYGTNGTQYFNMKVPKTNPNHKVIGANAPLLLKKQVHNTIPSIDRDTALRSM